MGALTASVLFLVSIGSRYYVGEFSATVGELPELLLAALANAAVLGGVGVAALWSGRVGRVGTAMAVPVCLGAAIARFGVWLEVVRGDVDPTDLGSAYRIQNQAGLVAGIAGLAAAVALIRASRLRHGSDARARAAGFFGLVGVACFAISYLGDWYRYRSSGGERETIRAGGAVLPEVLTADPALTATLIVMTVSALAVALVAPRASAVGLAAGVVLGNILVAAADTGVFSGTFVAESGVSPTLVYLWRVAALGLSVTAFVLIRRVAPDAFRKPRVRDT